MDCKNKIRAEERRENWQRNWIFSLNDFFTDRYFESKGDKFLKKIFGS